MIENTMPTATQLTSAAKPSALITLSHELRTPVHGVLGLIEMLKSETLTPAGERIVERLNATADSLMQILNGAVEAQRIAEGKVTLATRRYSLLDVVETAIKMYASEIEAKGVELCLQFDPRLLGREFIGDAERQLQVLAALLSNAAKFTDSGSITLVVALRQEKVSSTQVVIQLIDTGIGIEEEHVRLICELGYQVQSAQRGRPSGTGVGLYLAHNLLTLQNSRLQIRSNASGSSFSYTQDLPASTEPEFFWRATAGRPSVRILAPTGANFELMKQCLENQGIEVEYRQEFSPADLERPTDLCLLDYRLAASNLALFKSMRESLPSDALVVLTTEFEPATALLTRSAKSWYTPYLPSQLMALAEDAGVVERTQQDRTVGGGQQEFSLPADLSNYALLCVDDSPTNLIVLIGALTKLGFKKIIRAKDGLEAVEECKAHPEIDLVLMDFHMPRMNGSEAAQTIKSLGITVPILGVTALSESELNSQIGEGDFIEVLTKPVTLNVLSRSLAQHLPQKSLTTRSAE